MSNVQFVASTYDLPHALVSSVAWLMWHLWSSMCLLTVNHGDDEDSNNDNNNKNNNNEYGGTDVELHAPLMWQCYCICDDDVADNRDDNNW